jgi:hypothetical protein
MVYITNDLLLIPQPGRAVTTFPSGLVRVDQTYFGLTEKQATHRALLAVGANMPDGDKYPAIDWPNSDGTNFEPTLKIFPEVQESRREEGFTDYRVSAYGRTNESGITTRGLTLEKYSESFSINQGEGVAPAQYTVEEFWEIETLTMQKTLKSTETMEDFPAAPTNLFKRLRNRRVTGTVPSGSPATLYLSWSVVVLSAQRTNFGHIDELTITFGYAAE